VSGLVSVKFPERRTFFSLMPMQRKDVKSISLNTYIHTTNSLTIFPREIPILKSWWEGNSKNSKIREAAAEWLGNFV
jgi:hypothetical protein